MSCCPSKKRAVSGRNVDAEEIAGGYRRSRRKTGRHDERGTEPQEDGADHAVRTRVVGLIGSSVVKTMAEVVPSSFLAVIVSPATANCARAAQIMNRNWS